MKRPFYSLQVFEKRVKLFVFNASSLLLFSLILNLLCVRMKGYFLHVSAFGSKKLLWDLFTKKRYMNIKWHLAK